MSQRKIRVTTDQDKQTSDHVGGRHCHFVDLNPLQFSKPTCGGSTLYNLYSMKPNTYGFMDHISWMWDEGWMDIMILYFIGTFLFRFPTFCLEEKKPQRFKSFTSFLVGNVTIFSFHLFTEFSFSFQKMFFVKSRNRYGYVFYFTTLSFCY